MATAKRKRSGKASGRQRRDARSAKRAAAPDLLARIGDELAATMREVLEELAAWLR